MLVCNPEQYFAVAVHKESLSLHACYGQTLYRAGHLLLTVLAHALGKLCNSVLAAADA